MYRSLSGSLEKLASPSFKVHDMCAIGKDKDGNEACVRDDKCATDLVSKESVSPIGAPNCSVCSRPHGAVAKEGDESFHCNGRTFVGVVLVVAAEVVE